jgi:hypothetical protein
MMRFFSLVLSVVLLCGTNAWGLSFYHIGNSLSTDSQPYASQVMGQSLGMEFFAGYHLKSASTMRDIWNDPTTTATFLTNPGPTWEVPLSGREWDALVLQPHNKTGNTQQVDVTYAQKFVDYARSAGKNEGMQVYMFSTYPSQTEGWGNWTSPYASGPNQPATHRRAYFENVASNLTTVLGEEVHIIPAGDVLHRIIQEIAAGTVPNLDATSDLYRDPIHLSNMGRLASACTVFATITGRSPVGLPTMTWTEGSADTVLRIQQLAWEVVSNHSRSGVQLADGDFNGDGLVDLGDYTLWRDNVGEPVGTLANDPNDTPIGDAQYLTWKQNFGSYASSAVSRSLTLGSTTVPEVGSGAMLAGGILCLLAATALSWRGTAA